MVLLLLGGMLEELFCPRRHARALTGRVLPDRGDRAARWRGPGGSLEEVQSGDLVLIVRQIVFPWMAPFPLGLP